MTVVSGKSQTKCNVSSSSSLPCCQMQSARWPHLLQQTNHEPVVKIISPASISWIIWAIKEKTFENVSGCWRKPCLWLPMLSCSKRIEPVTRLNELKNSEEIGTSLTMTTILLSFTPGHESAHGLIRLPISCRRSGNAVGLMTKQQHKDSYKHSNWKACGYRTAQGCHKFVPFLPQHSCGMSTLTSLASKTTTKKTNKPQKHQENTSVT